MNTKKFPLRRDGMGRACAIAFQGVTIAHLSAGGAANEFFAGLMTDGMNHLCWHDSEPKPNLAAREIIAQYLRANGYDGIGRDEDDCACLVDDLGWCGGILPECYAGYRVPCETCEQDFRIVATKGDTDDRE